MLQFCLMSSHGYPPGFGAVFHPENGVRKDWHHFFHCRSSHHDLVDAHSFNLCLQQKQDRESTGGRLVRKHLPVTNFRRPTLIDVRDAHPESLLLGFGIVEQCTRQEKILKLLASMSIEVEGGLLDLSVLYDIMGPELHMMDSPQEPFASYFKWCSHDAKSQQPLIYPTTELYFNEPLFDLVGARSNCAETRCHPTGTEMSDIMLPVFSELYFLKTSTKFSKQTMLVPYFERRRRGRSNTNSSKLATEKVLPLKRHEKAKAKTPHKRKTRPKTGRERDICSNNYLYACESLLSIIVDKQHQGRNAIVSLKKSGPELTQLLNRFSTSIAGTGIAVVLSVVCRVACNRAPLSASKLLSMGLGLGLLWLSLAVNKLRDTVLSISKTSGKLGAKADEMMDRLDRNLKEIYFRAAALMAVAVLPLA